MAFPARWVARAALVALLAFASPARAVGVRLGLGGDYWFYNQGFLHLTLAVDAHLAEHFAIGGRFGGMITTLPYTLGVPVDFLMRVSFAQHRVYLEGVVGPWILIDNRPLRIHAAFGFGLQTRYLAFGLELGWLDPSPHAGLRVAFRI